MGVVVVSLLGLLASALARGGSPARPSPSSARPPAGFVLVRWPGGVVELVPEHLSPALPSTRGGNDQTKGTPCPQGTVRHCYESPPGSWNIICECKRLGITKKGPKPQAAKPPKPPAIDCAPGETYVCSYPEGASGSAYCRCTRPPVSAGPGINTIPGDAAPCCDSCAANLKGL